MSAKSLLAAFGLGCLALLATGETVAQTPSPAQLQAFKSLPAAQQQALMQQYLGGGAGGLPAGATQPATSVSPKNSTQNAAMLKALERARTPKKTRDGHYLRQPNENPELRPGDSVMIALAPARSSAPSRYRGQSGNAGRSGYRGQSGNAGRSGYRGQSGNAGAATAVDRTSANAYGGGRFEHRRVSAERQEEIDAFRARVLRGNPYQLNRYGALEIPGIEAIPLAGLTQYEASARLSGDPDLSDFRVTLTLLRVQPTGEAALRPFGYDVFTNPASTFAPVSNVPVPADYVVGPGDTLDVQLYGNEPASYVLAVGRDGRIDFPKLGPIMVSGMSFDGARAAIERRVAQQLIGTRVSVTMGALRTIRIFVLGEVKRPGSYTVGGLSTMTNALFASGGIKRTGSLRRIELKRDGQLVTTLDLYDLLLHGDTSGDSHLLPGDVIFVPPIGRSVAIDGAVLRPAIYELKDETTIGQVIDMAGGLLPDADQRRIDIERILPSREYETVNVDLSSGQGRASPVENGDKIHIAAIRPTLENSVVLSGFVYRPGAFAYRPGMRLSDVLSSFEELKPNADPHYILIRRIVPPDDQVEVVSADLSRALAERGGAADPLLQPRDKITVFDLSASRVKLIRPIIRKLELESSPDHPAAVVSIDGQVKAPGRYPLEPGMRVSDLIRAGGSLDDAAFSGTAELMRYRVIGGHARRSKVIEVNLGAIRRGDASADIKLRPYDLLIIKTVPEWQIPGSVVLAGEVRFPGKYPVQRGETLHELLIQAGGLTKDAFPQGAVFTRTELKVKEKAQMELLASRFQNDLAAMSLRSVAGGATGTSLGVAAAAGASQGLAIGQQVVNELRTTRPVGRLVINLRRIIRNRAGAPGDVTLRGGDRLFVPKMMQTVTVMGEVQDPNSQLYRRDWTRGDYISRSGGLTQNADKDRIYVVRADGNVVGGERTGWFRRSRSVEMRPGDTIVVPIDAERIPALPLWTAATTILYNIAIAVLALKSL